MEDAGTTTCACLEIDPYMEGQLCVVEGKGAQPYPVFGIGVNRGQEGPSKRWDKLIIILG